MATRHCPTWPNRLRLPFSSCQGPQNGYHKTHESPICKRYEIPLTHKILQGWVSPEAAKPPQKELLAPLWQACWVTCLRRHRVCWWACVFLARSKTYFTVTQTEQKPSSPSLCGVASKLDKYSAGQGRLAWSSPPVKCSLIWVWLKI